MGGCSILPSFFQSLVVSRVVDATTGLGRVGRLWCRGLILHIVELASWRPWRILVGIVCVLIQNHHWDLVGEFHGQ